MCKCRNKFSIKQILKTNSAPSCLAWLVIPAWTCGFYLPSLAINSLNNRFPYQSFGELRGTDLSPHLDLRVVPWQKIKKTLHLHGQSLWLSLHTAEKEPFQQGSVSLICGLFTQIRSDDTSALLELLYHNFVFLWYSHFVLNLLITRSDQLPKKRTREEKVTVPAVQDVPFGRCLNEWWINVPHLLWRVHISLIKLALIGYIKVLRCSSVPFCSSGQDWKTNCVYTTWWMALCWTRLLLWRSILSGVLTRPE